jgi:hypothetical protein
MTLLPCHRPPTGSKAQWRPCMLALLHVSLAEAGLRSAQPRGEASDSVRNDSVPYFVLAAMATVPPRFSVLPAAVQDMFSQQTTPPDRLLVIMALSYRHFPIEVAQVRGTAERLQAAHTKCRCHVLERDHGPISKIVGALHHLREQAEDLRRRTLLVTVDDDLVYPRWLLENLVLWARHYPITAHAGGTYRGVTQRQLTVYGPYPGETIRGARGTFPVGRLLECAARRVNYLYGWGGVAYGPGVPESLGLLEHLEWLNGSCWSCDDQYISGHAISRGVPIYVISFPRGKGVAWTLRGQLPRAARPNASKALSSTLQQAMVNMLLRFKLKTWLEVPHLDSIDRSR